MLYGTILNIFEYRSFDVRVVGKPDETQQDSPRSGSAFVECLRNVEARQVDSKTVKIARQEATEDVHRG